MENQAIMLREIKKLQTYHAEQSTTPVNQTINQTIISQNITINIASFGSEDIKHIEESKEFLTRCLMEKNIIDIIEKIHFDKDYPENQNVRLKSLKHGMMEMYIDGRWIIKDKGETYDRLVDKGANILKFHTKRNKKQVIAECEEEQEDFDELKEYIDFVQEDRDLKNPVLKKLDILFVNDSSVVLSQDEFD